ncbi:hypothetical protein [Sphingomonas sp. GV3]|uniref:hypothetical protein n=1 Tax=Sphingomonas sp. GV3 TaxID=3040671 RepID=UPI00280AFB64|nr:hypothetical protein [Sphingomonas sp. GV3]
MVVSTNRQDATERRRAKHVRVTERVPGTIDTVALAVPDAEHAVGTARSEGLVHLRAPECRGRQVLVQAGLEHHVARLEVLASLPELLIVGAERRSPVAGDQACRIEPPRSVEAALHERQADERLDSGHEGGPVLGVVDGFQAGDTIRLHGKSSRRENTPNGLASVSKLGSRGGRA